MQDTKDQNEQEYKNYVLLSKFSILNQYYIFADAKEYLADIEFVKHKVRVDFGKEYIDPSGRYHLIFCTIRKRDAAEFVAALESLKKKMLICGHPDYPDFCKEFMSTLDEDAEEMHKEKRKKLSFFHKAGGGKN